VPKATHASLLALTVVAILAGCSKKEAPPAETAAAPAAPVASEAPKMPANHPVAEPGEEVDLAGIAKAEGGKTVAEVFAEKDALGGKPVTVRGKVVKVNAGIMGKNWLHVRDGSGAEGTNDLTVTTAAELPALGTTVVVTGPVTLNKDFGMGYTYDVIVEDAEVKAEPAGS
jgi:predicted small lipoprotein YifL